MVARLSHSGYVNNYEKNCYLEIFCETAVYIYMMELLVLFTKEVLIKLFEVLSICRFRKQETPSHVRGTIWPKCHKK